MKQEDSKEILQQYGVGPIQFSGTNDALYERHLTFDHVVDVKKANLREQFEAAARSIRDIISQRWLRTEDTYVQKNPKRVYYLSMEFLLGRSLANNMTNALLYPLALEAVKKKGLDPLALNEMEPDAGLGNGGLGRLAACFIDSMATMQIPGMGYGLRYEYGIFKQTIKDGWQCEQPDNWLRRPDPWEVARLEEAVEVKLNCSFELREGMLRPIVGRPSILIGIPFDRPVVGYGGKTINTLRLWAASTPDYFDFQQFSQRRFRGRIGRDARGGVAHPRALSRRFDNHGPGVAVLCRNISSSPARSPISCGDSGAVTRIGSASRESRDPAERHAPGDGRSRADADSAGRRAPRLGPGVGSHATDTRIYEPHAAARSTGKMAARMVRDLLPRHLEIIHEINRRHLDQARARFAGDEGRLASVSLIEEGGMRKIRMANLAIVGSHSTNGVAAIHSGLLRSMTVKDLAEMYPERFNNKTNGVTPRRWLLLANPALSQRSRRPSATAGLLISAN